MLLLIMIEFFEQNSLKILKRLINCVFQKLVKLKILVKMTIEEYQIWKLTRIFLDEM